MAPRKYLLLFILLLPASTIYSQVRISVPNNYSKIQDAINASSSGDTILVNPGTYSENIIFNGKNIVLASCSKWSTRSDSSHTNTTYPQTADEEVNEFA